MESQTEEALDVFFGSRLRSMRRLRALTQTELGEQIGVSFQQVQKYERGTNRISLSKAVRISEALDIPISSLFSGLPSGHRLSAGLDETLNFDRIGAVEALVSLPSGLRESLVNCAKSFLAELARNAD